MTEIAHTWAERISAAWRKGFESVMLAGKLLTEAKEQLPHGEFGKMIRSELPFTMNTAERLMVVARDARLSNPAHAHSFPPHWTTLYEITKLDDQAITDAIEAGVIRPDMERKDITQQIKKARRQSREIILGVSQRALPNKQYGVIVADPEWRFEPWSRDTGMDRAADNHYPTSCLEVIAARDVPSIAANDCVLFLWSTAPMQPQAQVVMAAWGFDYKTQIIWHKLRSGDGRGTGYWVTGEHELLLIGTRGKIVAPATAMCRSLIAAPWQGKHSAKPEIFLEIIEQQFPTLPKIELNRRGPARPGWDAWGNETDQTNTERAASCPATAAAPEPSPVSPHPSGEGSTSSDIPPLLRIGDALCWRNAMT